MLGLLATGFVWALQPTSDAGIHCITLASGGDIRIDGRLEPPAEVSARVTTLARAGKGRIGLYMPAPQGEGELKSMTVSFGRVLPAFQDYRGPRKLDVLLSHSPDCGDMINVADRGGRR